MATALRKCFSAAFALWLIATLSFTFLYCLPGDPARMILGPHASNETISQFRSKAGLDQSLVVQYSRFIWRLGHLNLGNSFTFHQPVTELLRERGGSTLKLTAGATTFVLLFGFALPLTLELIRKPKLMWVCESVLTTAALAPPYVLAIGALLLVVGGLGWISVMFEPERLAAWVLPSAVLGTYPAALVFRLFSERLHEELRSAYVRRARALGLSHARVLFAEVLPNALPAALAALTNSLAFFVTGAFFVEIVFGIPGWGRLAQEALRNKDMSVLSGLCLAFGFAMLLLSAALDLIQREMDPRVAHTNAHF
jgi:peptide/nickel transport system permease protein